MSVNPAILVWARETAGLSVPGAADALGIKPAYGRTAEERLRAYESGDAEVSRTLLSKMVKLYRRSLLTFYLAMPPQKAYRGEDFRTLPEGRPPSEDARVDALLRDIKVRQSVVRSVLEDEEDREPRTFVGSATVDQGRATVAQSVAQVIGFNVQTFRNQGNSDNAFKWLRAKVETTGVYVLLLGNLGTHHTAIDVTVFRGFALSDLIAPFIVINDQDAKSAWSFTLLHEFTHLMLGVTGVSGLSTQTDIEQFCNDVASELLLPEEDFERFPAVADEAGDALERAISNFAEPRRISASMVAYQLFRRGLISRATWTTVAERFRQMFVDDRARRREAARQTDGGPQYYVVRRHRVGNALLSFVRQSMAEGVLTPTKAGMVLGVKPRGVESMLSGNGRGEGAAA